VTIISANRFDLKLRKVDVVKILTPTPLMKPTIWIGVVSQVEEGDVMNSAIISDINTELSLLGIASADIVMSGGGAGPSATPFMFTLENIVMA
jgi:hypothetical protein